MEKYNGVPREYIEAVTALADNKTNKRFLNDSSAHARLLADLMIGRGNSDSLIYSKNLPISCYRDAILEAVNAKKKVKVLVEESIDNLSWKKTIPNFETFIDIKKITPSFIGQINHFFVSGHAFRYEKDHDQATAISNFNEPSVAASLKDSFMFMWNASE